MDYVKPHEMVRSMVAAGVLKLTLPAAVLPAFIVDGELSAPNRDYRASR